MRSALLVIVSAGCSFEVRPTGASVDAPTDAPSADAAIDGPPPPLPACATMAAYQAGGPQPGHRYRVTNNAINYDEAVERCASDGAHLVQIDDANENAFIDTLLNNNQGWLGLNDLDREGTYAWLTRSPVMFRVFGGGEPNDDNQEDCVHMRNDGLWNDASCDADMLAVCECDPLYVAPAVAACRAMAGSTSLEGRRYFIRNTELPWPEAAADCAAIGAHLAVPGDDDENTAIDNSFPGESWIGYADRNIDGVLEWVNGVAPGYTRWGPSQPSIGASELCVAIAFTTPSGGWDDTVCSTPRRYACECDPLTR